MKLERQPCRIGVLIRFSNSETTLPDVMSALTQQTYQAEEILGITNGSSDDSRQILTESGARVVDWKAPYHHSKVLNSGLSELQTDLVFVLSSHTVLKDRDTLKSLAKTFDDSRVACASLRWDTDPYYSDEIDWDEMEEKGLRFGSIYSNSMGMIRRSFWCETPFDESVHTAEDYAWALEQLRRGNLCRRLDLPFSYQRTGSGRDRAFAEVVFRLSSRYQLPVAWLGPANSLKLLLIQSTRQDDDHAAVRDRLLSWLDHRLREFFGPSSSLPNQKSQVT